MLKHHQNIFFNKLSVEQLLCTLLVLLIAFSSFNDFTFSKDVETEKIENFADIEKENNKQEKLDQVEKDVVFAYAHEYIESKKIKSLYSRQFNSLFHTYFLKIPTPPPDFI